MTGRLRIIPWFLGIAACLLVGQFATAEPPPQAAPNADSLLLLHNGRTIVGRIAPAGEYYYVSVPNGKLRIRADQVEFWCNSLEEGYRRKQAVARAGTIEDHLRLAHWCLRQKLTGRATEELAVARRIDPTHPLIGLLDRQLEVAANPPAPRPARPSKPDPEQHPAAEDGPTPEQLEAMVEALPARSVETFTRSIQPLLVNTCGSAACHGPGSEAGFQLRRIPLGRPASRRTTQQNLHEVLQWIDCVEPGSSPLLARPAGPHGPAGSPVFAKSQAAQQTKLAAWVYELTATGATVARSTAAAAADRSGGAIATGATAVPGLLAQPAEARPLTIPPLDTMSSPTPKEPVEPASFEAPASSPNAAADSQPEAPQVQPLPGGVQRGAKVEGFVPQDPFDPEQFNRRFYPKK